jgi:leucine dehydrogenase
MTSTVLSDSAARGHEQVVFFNYPEVGLKAIVAIHNTVLGPGLGGCRMRLYDDESQALEDVLRLSEGMTYKSALAHLPLGGGKACIIADPKLTQGRELLFKKFGDCLNHIAGRYITAEDMGTSVGDMMWIKSQTNFVVGTDPAKGGAGDPSPWTARGVFLATKAAVERVFANEPVLRGKRVALQGVGHVGMHLLEFLVKEGATVTVCDTNDAALKEASSKYGAAVVATDAIYDVPSDIFSPCAIGQTVNPGTIARLSSKIIVGAANNQLSDRAVYGDIEKKGILYCPDFAVNSGGVICVGAERAPGGPNTAWIKEKVELIYNTTCQVLDQSKARGKFTEEVAVELAKERIAAARRS